MPVKGEGSGRTFMVIGVVIVVWLGDTLHVEVAAVVGAALHPAVGAVDHHQLGRPHFVLVLDFIAAVVRL